MKKGLKIRIVLSLALSLPFIVTSSFNACSNIGFEGFEASTGGGNFDEPINDLSIEGKNTLPVSLQSAEQVLYSMSSVAGVPVNNNIQTEYNRRETLLASGYDIKMINSPMWIGITNIASTVCNELITKEAALPLAQREFFGDVDFTRSVSSVDLQKFENVVEKMSERFWGRELYEEEVQALTLGRSDFEKSLDSTDAVNPTQTRNLMLYTCTGMLASFETISL